jgi:hypothetical protein
MQGMADSLFWCLNHPASTARLADWDDKMDIEGIKCPIDEGHARGGKRLMDLSVVLPAGAAKDFVWTWGSACLAQDHVLKLFQANAFTGYQVKPVKARFKSERAQGPPTLWEIVVTGWAGMAPAESGIKLVERCDGCGYLVYSGCTDPEKLIDVSQWDGSDFFMVWPLPKFIFVTNRVAQIIRDNRLSGVVLKRPRELDLSGGSVGISPGRLSRYMPEDRARELGAALGID